MGQFLLLIYYILHPSFTRSSLVLCKVRPMLKMCIELHWHLTANSFLHVVFNMHDFLSLVLYSDYYFVLSTTPISYVDSALGVVPCPFLSQTRL